jgi:acyl-CoA oxidase
VLPLCIRLVSELLQGHYSIPLPDRSESVLANHAVSLLEENKDLIKTFPDHRSEEYNSLILPQSQIIVEALGHALAYSAALHANMPRSILDLYECSVIRLDPAWYTEHGLSRMSQRYREDDAISSALPNLSSFLDALHIENYVSAPIVSDAAWKKYVFELPVHSGNAVPIQAPLMAML